MPVEISSGEDSGEMLRVGFRGMESIVEIVQDVGMEPSREVREESRDISGQLVLETRSF